MLSRFAAADCDIWVCQIKLLFHTLLVNFIRVAGKEPPFYLQIIDRGLQPLQGVFNILVYTSPHVTTIRRVCPELNWFQAFFWVVMNGGDDDQANEERRSSRSNLRSSLSSRRGSNASMLNQERRHSRPSNLSRNMSSRGSGNTSMLKEGQRADISNNALTVSNQSSPESGIDPSKQPQIKSIQRRRQSFVKNTNRGDIDLFSSHEKYVKAAEKCKGRDIVVDIEEPVVGRRVGDRRVSFVDEIIPLAESDIEACLSD